MFDPNKLAAGLRLIAEAFETQEAQSQTETEEPQTETNVINMYGSPVPESPTTQETLPPAKETLQVPRDVLVAKLTEVAQISGNEKVVELLKTVAPSGRFSEVPEPLYGALYAQAQEALRGGAA